MMCKECGKEFQKKRFWQKFCSKPCQMANFWKKEASKTLTWAGNRIGKENEKDKKNDD